MSKQRGRGRRSAWGGRGFDLLDRDRLEDLDGAGRGVDRATVTAGPGIGIIVAVDPEQQEDVALLGFEDDPAPGLVNAYRAQMRIAGAGDPLVVDPGCSRVALEVGQKLGNLALNPLRQPGKRPEEIVGNGHSG